MAIAEHLDILDAYGAMAVRVVGVDGEPEDLLGEGGRLAETFERVGHRALLGVLRDADVRSVLLADGDLAVSVEREGRDGRLRVSWGGSVVVDQVVEIPPADPVRADALFRPDPAAEIRDVRAALHDPALTLYAVTELGGEVRWFAGGLHGPGVGARPLVGTVPAVVPASLGSAAFRADHGARWAYAARCTSATSGSVAAVLALARAGLVGICAPESLGTQALDLALRRVRAAVTDQPWGFEVRPDSEGEAVDLYLRYAVPTVLASGYTAPTSALVLARLSGLDQRDDGTLQPARRLVVTAPCVEVAETFLRPPPAALMATLRDAGLLTALEAELGARLPMASDVAVVGDDGGDTEHRALTVLLPVALRARAEISAELAYRERGVVPRVGAAGGLGTPAAVWSALAGGADFVLTDAVNQCAVEASTSTSAKQRLAEVPLSDVIAGPTVGAFNAWARGTDLEDPQGRQVDRIAAALMGGAAAHARVALGRALGLPLPLDADVVGAPG